MLQKMAQVMQRNVKLVDFQTMPMILTFCFHLHFMLLILGHANVVSHSLQIKDKDILEAMVEV
jgi:hypothetical protein